MWRLLPSDPSLTCASLQLPACSQAVSSVLRYMITSLDRTHAGFYRCIVRNRMGALLQRQTEVQVACEYKGGWEQGREKQGRVCSVCMHQPHSLCGHWVLRVARPTYLGQCCHSIVDATKAWGGGRSSRGHMAAQ